MNAKALQINRRYLFVGITSSLSTVAFFVLNQNTKKETADLLVAFGTIALAAVTTWSVFQTNRVIAGEDRRHQQTFAPLVVLEDAEADDRSGLFIGNVRNDGQGLAVNVRMVIDGYASTAATQYNPLIKTVESLPRLPIAEQWRQHNIAFVPAGLQRGFNFPNTRRDQKFVFEVVEILYTDMFGNDYATKYEAFSANPNMVKWMQPPILETPRS